MTDKRCTKCKQVLEPSAFNKNKAKHDGLATECRECCRAYGLKYYAENKEGFAAHNRADYLAKSEDYKRRARAWEKANPEKKKELRAKYRAADPDKANLQSRIDWEKHGDKRRARKKIYRQANPERGAAYCRNRQARKANAMPSWADRGLILQIYREARRLTAETGVKHHVDHIVPLAGKMVCGLHVDYNLEAIPALENHRKSNKVPEALCN